MIVNYNCHGYILTVSYFVRSYSIRDVCFQILALHIVNLTRIPKSTYDYLLTYFPVKVRFAKRKERRK